VGLHPIRPLARQQIKLPAEVEATQTPQAKEGKACQYSIAD